MTQNKLYKYEINDGKQQMFKQKYDGDKNKDYMYNFYFLPFWNNRNSY